MECGPIRWTFVAAVAAILPGVAQGQIERPAEIGNGAVGQRQTREETPVNTAPLERIDSRIANRVQNRIRNRIDRYYDPSANATSPFEVAGDQARRSGGSPR